MCDMIVLFQKKFSGRIFCKHSCLVCVFIELGVDDSILHVNQHMFFEYILRGASVAIYHEFTHNMRW